MRSRCVLRHRQRGVAAVEAAVVLALFLFIVFAVIEFGRLLWVWGSLNEATRRGARVAAVCPVNDPVIARIAVFNAPDAGETASAILYGLDTSHVVVGYLDAAGADVVAPEDTAPGGGWATIRYVKVTISGYQHTMLIPLFDMLPAGYQPVLTAPPFETVIPRESLGVVPDEGVGCFVYI